VTEAQQGVLPAKLEHLRPRDKGDIERASQLIDIGYPDNAEALPLMFTWLADGNWPIAGPAADYLSRLGWAVLPHVRSVLSSQDEQWVYWVLDLVVRRFPNDLIAELEPNLRALAEAPSGEEVDLLARDILAGVD